MAKAIKVWGGKSGSRSLTVTYSKPHLEGESVLAHIFDHDQVEGETNGRGVRGAAQSVLLKVFREDVTSLLVRPVATVVVAVTASLERHAVAVAARELILLSV